MADKSNIEGGNSKSTEGSNNPSDAKRTKKDETNEGPSTSNESPVEKALQNTLVLQTIFKFLPYDVLQICRQVDLPLWQMEAEHALNKRPLLSITLRKEQTTMDKIFIDKKFQFEFQNIAELSLKLENCEKGQEIWLTTSNITSEELETFIKKFSNVISHLDVSYSDFYLKSPADLAMLLKEIPYLSHLRLASIPVFWKFAIEVFPSQIDDGDVSKFGEPILLPQIKTVSFGQGNNFYPDLLRSFFQIMPNLENIFSFPQNCIPDSNDAELKLDKIRSVHFYGLPYVSIGPPLSQLAKISAKTNLQIADLRFKIPTASDLMYLWNSLRESLGRIFQNNQDTLEYLIIEPFVLPEMIIYPEMKAVQKLRLIGWESMSCYRKNGEKSGQFFGENFNVGATFPNLTEVTLEGCYTLAGILNFFPDDAFTQNNFKGVTSLNIKLEKFDDSSIEPLEKAAKLFPHVTRLFINGHAFWHMSCLAHVLRLWPKLTSLKVRVYMSQTKDCPEYFLDSVFTGIPAERCNELRENEEKLEDLDLKSYRTNFGIPNMTDLTELTLIIGGRDRFSHEPEKVIPLFSEVALFYGFQCLPDLKVTCAIPWDCQEKEEIREMLTPNEKYLILNPNHYESFDHAVKYTF